LPQESDKALRDLLCVNAIALFEVYLDHTPLTKDSQVPPSDSKLSSIRFLQHFDVLQQGKVKSPIWDNFTEAMIRRTKTPDAYLPFVFRMSTYEMCNVETMLSDVLEEFAVIILRNLMKIEYYLEAEDYMWEIGQKPEYMSSGDLKFSNVYLSSMHTLLNWIQELLKTKDQSG
jgi:hypothetical protein